MKKKPLIIGISVIIGFLLGSILATIYPYVSSLIPWIIGLVVGSIGLIYLSIKKPKVPSILQETPDMQRKSLIYDDAHNLLHLFIISKKASICLFDQSYIKIRFDPQLIGGFLTAITQFGSELMGSRKLEELTYQKFKILIGEGNFIQVALILERNASEIMKASLNDFIKQIEERYWDYLARFEGQIEDLPEIFQIIESNYFISLTLPHKVSEGLKTLREFTTFEKSILNIANALSQEKGNFLTKDIIVIANITQMGTRAQIISTIFDLCREGILYPLLFLAPENIWKEFMEKRELLINKAEKTFEEGKLALATKYFEEAAEIASELGDLDTFFELKKKVEDIRSKEPLIKKQIEERKKQERLREIQNRIVSFMNFAQEAYKQNNYLESENYLNQALVLAINTESIGIIQNLGGFYSKLLEKLPPLEETKKTEMLMEKKLLLKVAESARVERNEKTALDLYRQIAKLNVSLRNINEVGSIMAIMNEIKKMKVKAVSTTKIPQLIKPLLDDDKISYLESKVLRLCDGKNTLDVICKEAEAPKLKVLEIINKYQKRGYLNLLTMFEE